MKKEMGSLARQSSEAELFFGVDMKTHTGGREGRNEEVSSVQTARAQPHQALSHPWTLAASASYVQVRRQSVIWKMSQLL